MAVQHAGVNGEPMPVATPALTGLANRQARWMTVLLLSLLLALSFVDRFILALLAQPVSHSLGLGDKQIAILLGTAFSILYAVIGVPIARFIDKGDRRRIVAGGVILWSLATMASAAANSFAMLLVLRAGVAIGEAVLTPAAISMIADLFDRRERTLPTSIYMAITSVMASGSFIVGAAVLDIATTNAGAIGYEPWRITLFLVGAPGILLGLIMALAIREPGRGAADEEAVYAHAEALPYLRANLRIYGPFLAAIGFSGMMSYAVISWASTLLVRATGATPSVAGYLFGIVGVPMGLLGTFLWPRIAARGKGDAGAAKLFETAMLCVIIAALAMITLFFVDSRPAILVCLALTMGTLPSLMVLAALVVQRIAPVDLRGRMVAYNLLTLNLVGYTLGPLIVAAVSDKIGGPAGFRFGFGTLALFAGPISIFLFNLASKRSAEALAR